MDKPVSVGLGILPVAEQGLDLDLRMATIFILQDSERQFGIDIENVISRLRSWASNPGSAIFKLCDLILVKYE